MEQNQTLNAASGQAFGPIANKSSPSWGSFPTCPRQDSSPLHAQLLAMIIRLVFDDLFPIGRIRDPLLCLPGADSRWQIRHGAAYRERGTDPSPLPRQDSPGAD